MAMFGQLGLEIEKVNARVDAAAAKHKELLALLTQVRQEIRGLAESALERATAGLQEMKTTFDHRAEK